MNLRRVATALLVAVVVLAPSTGASALGGGAPAADASPSPTPSASRGGGTPLPLTFGLKPRDAGRQARSDFRMTLTPGSTTNDVVVVYNYSSVPLALSLYATDGYTAPGGGFALLPRDQKPTGVGSWIKLLIPDDTILRVPARSKVDVPFLVRTPTGVTPGDMAGGIVVSLRSRSTDDSGTAINVDSRVATKLLVRVPGAVTPQLAIEDLSATSFGTLNPFGRGSAQVSYVVHNTGNITLAGSQTVTLTGWFGQSAAVTITDRSAILPGSSVRITVPFDDVAPVGLYTASVDLQPLANIGDPAGDAVSGVANFWAVPWALLGLITALVALGYAMWRRRRLSALPPAGGGRHGAPSSAPTSEVLVP